MNFYGKETISCQIFEESYQNLTDLIVSSCSSMVKIWTGTKEVFSFSLPPWPHHDMLPELATWVLTFIQCPTKESGPLTMTLLTTAGCCWTETLQLNACNFHFRLRQVTRLRQILKWAALVWKNGGLSSSSAGCILLHSHPLDLIIEIPTSRLQNQRWRQWRAWAGTFRCLWNACLVQTLSLSS